MNWLRAHSSDPECKDCSITSIEDGNIMPVTALPATQASNGASAQNLIQQVADLFKRVDGYAAERHARADALARQAIEKLKAAEERVRLAELGRRNAEAELAALSERVEDFRLKIAEMGTVFEQRATELARAEKRANDVEEALRIVETTILTQILKQLPQGESSEVFAAAA
jgi:predicted nuclease with TOPRIM domain